MKFANLGPKFRYELRSKFSKKNPDLLLFFGGRARPDTQRQGILLFYPLKVLYLFVVFQTVRDIFGSN